MNSGHQRRLSINMAVDDEAELAVTKSKRIFQPGSNSAKNEKVLEAARKLAEAQDALNRAEAEAKRETSNKVSSVDMTL